MTFVVDIGNSAVKWILFEGDTPVRRGREASPGLDGTPPWISRLGGDAEGADRAVLVSVVPSLTAVVSNELSQRLGRAPLVVSSALRLPFVMAYRTPATLGADRLAAAAGALDLATRRGRNPGNLVVVDAGTALTVDRIGEGPTYEGGAIAPGPVLLATALRSGTAQLPAVPMDLPAEVIGRSTDEAIRVGVMHGFVAAAEGLITRMSRTQAASPFVVATGGWAQLLARETTVIDEVAPDLVLHGALTLLALNPG